MSEEKKAEKKSDNVGVVVMQNVPTTPITMSQDKNGNKFEIYDIDSAMTEILQLVRDIHKSVC